MSQYLGKNDFRLGLTTDIRGTFGNNAVLNTCHGFNPCSGDLIPIPSKGASESTIGFDATAKDFVIEYGGNFYSFNDFLNRNYTSILTVKQFFGEDIELYSKPVISGKQILYPTNKGLFSLEPNAYTGKSSVRYLSFMSPEDYTDTTENKPTATNPSVDRLRLFTTTTGDYTAANGTISAYKLFTESAANDAIKFEVTSNASAFSFSKAISLTADYTSGWFVYDLKIENDKQEYASTEMFENNDVVISGYEIAFKDASDNDLYVIGVPRCEPVSKKWYRLASYYELADPTLAVKIVFRTSYYYENDNATPTKIYLGCQDFNTALANTDNLRNQWRYVGNFIYNADTEETSSYKDIFVRDKDNEQETSDITDNIVKNADFENWQTNWEAIESGGRNLTATTNTDVVRDDITFTRCVKFDVAGSGGYTFSQLITVKPYCYYTLKGVGLTFSGSVDANFTLSASFDEDSKASRKTSAFKGTDGYSETDLLLEDVFTKGNRTIRYNFEVSQKMNVSNDPWMGFIAPRVFISSESAFYFTSRILYDYDLEDVFDDSIPFKHNCYTYSYSFAGRNAMETFDKYNTAKDNYVLMVSNPSEDSLKIADDPFTRPVITFTLPTKTINTTARNAIACYNDYITHALIYRSIINGATQVAQDYVYRGKAAINASISFIDNGDDTNEDFYKIDEYHYAPSEQEYENDFLESAKYVVNLNSRVYAGNLDNMNTAIAVSTYDKNWAFPTSVDESSSVATGTQLDNIHAVSSEITALAIVRDTILVFYDREIIRIAGNDFYSTNGFSTSAIARLKCINQYTIANTINELVFSDGLDFYITNGNSVTNISKKRINPSTIDFTTVSSLFHDNKYYILCDTKIYVYDLLFNSWYTIDKDSILQIIDSYDYIYCLYYDTTEETYNVAKLFGTTYSGTKTIETMYQIISSPQSDASVNDVAIEALSEYDNIRLNITITTQSEINQSDTRELVLNKNRIRYNKDMRVNSKACAIKTKIEYTGDKPPTILSIGVIRNGTSQRE